MNGLKVFCFITILGGCLADACDAQIYSWKDPHTGTSRMSNISPPWYRGSAKQRNAGPRTVVTVGLEVLDDSAKPIDETAFAQIRQKLSSLSAPPSNTIPPTPPDDRQVAAEASPGPSDSTKKPARGTRVEDAKTPPRKPLTAKEQSKMDEEEDREEMTKQRGTQAR
jgi:hypothetical protein